MMRASDVKMFMPMLFELSNSFAVLVRDSWGGCDDISAVVVRAPATIYPMSGRECRVPTERRMPFHFCIDKLPSG